MKRLLILTALSAVTCVIAGTGCPGTGGGNSNTGTTNNNANAPANRNGNGSTSDPTMRVIAGLDFYSKQGCGACHCNSAQGGCNLNAPAIVGASQATVDANLRFAQTAQEKPNEDDPVEAHPLKVSRASDDDILNVTMFLGTLDARSQLTETSAITRGYNLYVTGACVACHLPSAQGLTQGGYGNPIQGTEPDNIYFALAGGVACHPLQNPVPTIPPQVSCPINISDISQPGTFSTNAVVQALTEHPTPDTNDDRTLLSYFLQFIAPPPSGGVVDPCLGRSGEICTIAGNGISGFTGDEKAATATLLYNPLELELTDWNDDGTLDLGVVDWNNHRVRVIYIDKETATADGTMIRDRIVSLAGTGKVTGDDAINHCTDLAFDANGALVMANWHNQNMYRYPKGLRSGGDRDQLAGLCDLQCGGDDVSLNRVGDTKLSLPVSIQIHPDGRIFVAESGCSRLRVLTVLGERVRVQPPNCITPINFYPDGTLETIAGHVGMNGYSGDDGPAKDAIFNIDNTPLMPNMGLALSKDSPPAHLYLADSKNHCIRVINLLDEPPTIHLYAGTPTISGFKDGAALGEAQFNFPSNLKTDDNENVYVADASNNAVRRIDRATGRVTTLAGIGTPGFNGDNQPATMAQLNYPNGMAIHPDGRIFIADTNNNRIRVILP